METPATIVGSKARGGSRRSPPDGFVGMFCTCCRLPGQRPGGFFAEGIAPDAPDIEAAAARRAVYQRRAAFSSAPVVHPERTEFIIRRACILTMDPHIGDLATADLHVRDGLIVNIGRDLQASAMHEIDGRNAIVTPGFVAVHRHLSSAAASLDDDGRIPDLSAADAADVYRVVRLALLDAVASGITTLNHCAHDIGGEHAETAIVAHIDSGVRGRFSYPLTDAPSAETGDLEEIRRLEQTWFAAYGEHLLDLGIAIDDAAGDSVAASTALPIMTSHASDPAQRPMLDERTIGPAKMLEIDHCIGSLSPGKRADIVLIAAGPHGAAPLTPERGHDIARHATVSDILTVAVDGRLRKQNGVLIEPHEGLIRREGREAIERLRAEARWRPVVN